MHVLGGVFVQDEFCGVLIPFLFVVEVPNGEATDVEIPGKSSSEDDARIGAFASGENVLGTCCFHCISLEFRSFVYYSEIIDI